MTIKEIAKLAGVSASTVSKIMNNKDGNINPDTRSRVLKIVKEYNYTPYSSAILASRTKTLLIGLLVKSISHRNLMVNAIISTAQDNGYRVIVCDSSNSPEQELKHISALCKSHVDGVIWEPVSEESAVYQSYFSDFNIQSLYINSSLPESHSLDFSRMGYEATRHLINYKHTALACLIQSNNQTAEIFLEGFKKCLFDYQIPFQESMVYTSEDAEYNSQILANKTTGIVSSHFSASIRLYEELNRLQYQLPDELSLITLRDANHIGDYMQSPRISSIQIPFTEFGHFICQKLIGLCEHGFQTDTPFHVDLTLDHTDTLDLPYPLRLPSIVVVGSINIDTLLSVDSLPHTGTAISTSRYSLYPGGKGVNQAVGAARLGHQVSLIGKVGNDFDAGVIYASMKEHDINSTGIGRDLFNHTGKAYIHIQSDGDSMITLLTGANSQLTPEDIHRNKRLFTCAGYCLLQTEIPIETTLSAAHLAKEHRVKTILKPSGLHTLEHFPLHDIDIIVPNETESAALCPYETTLSGQADFFLKKGVGTVIITVGRKGCYVKNNDIESLFPAKNFVSVDNTGASDAFIAALASYLLYGYPLTQAVQIATYAAGFCITRQGVVPSLIDRNSLETYISQQQPELLDGITRIIS